MYSKNHLVNSDAINASSYRGMQHPGNLMGSAWQKRRNRNKIRKKRLMESNNRPESSGRKDIVAQSSNTVVGKEFINSSKK